MGHVRPQHVVDSALAASDAGMRDAANAAMHGVAVKTIRRWRRLYQRRGLPRGQAHTSAACPDCDGGALDEPAYAELLGWYLGDGHLSRGRRDVWNLHIYNDARYVHDNAVIAAIMRRVKPGGMPHTRLVPGCVITTVSWKHWICLLPQHGPGRKHERVIALEPWQEEIVERHSGPFLRGLLHSDGCRANNWTTRQVGGERRRYDYPRWQFSNRSEDILGLYTWALGLVDVPWRRSGRWCVSVSRREGVARLDDLVGPKR
ncbi:hypothetical protein GCM10009812_27180 [Nocardioides marinus]|uniref:Transcriptional regulator n=1 Tax=Nocardioides marinus TaxID=374514 RepID=A0A7Y9YE33_9ACTN|nr:transcriptional regulator [Nocardioides marinus]NYI10536.1 hypothetical protein [Nocardioides marinus]